MEIYAIMTKDLGANQVDQTIKIFADTNQMQKMLNNDIINFIMFVRWIFHTFFI